MLNFRLLSPIAGAFAIIALAGCQQKTKTEVATTGNQATVGTTVPAQQQKTTVCIWEGVPLREMPSKSGKCISSISLGESVEFLNDTKKDAGDKDREYLKVKLSDGKTGWAPSYGLVQDASIGVILESTAFYKRPDVLTITKEKLPSMAIVALGEEHEDWIMVTGEGKKISGWIKKGSFSSKPEDVVTAIFASKKLKEASNLSYSQKIQSIIETAPYPQSTIIMKLKESIASSQNVTSGNGVADTTQQETKSPQPTDSGSASGQSH